MDNECCGTCKWHEQDYYFEEDYICCNRDSDYVADYTDYNHSCDEWEERRCRLMVYTGCDKCKYDSKRTDEYQCNECIHGASLKEHYKPMTNAERIRNMSDEELATFIKCARCDVLYGNTCEQQPYCEGMLGKTCNEVERIDKGLLAWLQAEVKEGGEDECS